MTYDPGSVEPEAAEAAEATAEQVRTGVGRVDEVIRSVEELEERPIEEHVGVFEAAHTQLRHALDHPEEPGAGSDEE